MTFSDKNHFLLFVIKQLDNPYSYSSVRCPRSSSEYVYLILYNHNAFLTRQTRDKIISDYFVVVFVKDRKIS